MASVTLNSINKMYGDYHATRDVSFHIEDGEFVVFVGPSGCGKSTLLRMVAGLEEITGGDLLFDGERVNTLPPAARGVGMVFQSYALYPHMTVRENIGFGLKLAKTPRDEQARRVEEAAKALQLDALLDRKPKALSGGQRQRVAIGRAIVRKPRVFLFDEPLSNLDASLRVQMRLEIGRLHRDLGATMIYVTHDQVEAMTLADRIVVLEAGSVRQIGPPLELYSTPANKFVAGFIGSPRMNFWSGVIQGEGAQMQLLLSGNTETTMDLGRSLSGYGAGRPATLGVRPEHCALVNPDQGRLRAEVLESEQLGSDTFVYMSTPGAEDPVALRLSGVRGPRPGEIVGLAIEEDHFHCFDEMGERI